MGKTAGPSMSLLLTDTCLFCRPASEALAPGCPLNSYADGEAESQSSQNVSPFLCMCFLNRFLCSLESVLSPLGLVPAGKVAYQVLLQVCLNFLHQACNVRSEESPPPPRKIERVDYTSVGLLPELLPINFL